MEVEKTEIEKLPEDFDACDKIVEVSIAVNSNNVYVTIIYNDGFKVYKL